MTERLNLTNQFLIAMPAMDDPNFSQAVAYICEHSDEGAMGIIINHPLDISVGDVLGQLKLTVTDEPTGREPVYSGGPVMQERGFILHRPKGQWDSTLEVTSDIALTTSKDILAALADGSGPRESLFALGYAGWGAGQLESELSENAWLSAPADQQILFHLPPEKRWRAATQLIGFDPDMLSGESGHA